MSDEADTINSAVHPDVALRETRAVLERIHAGRLRPVTPAQLSHAIVTVLTREQEDFIETLTKDVWQLEQRQRNALHGVDLRGPIDKISPPLRSAGMRCSAS